MNWLSELLQAVEEHWFAVVIICFLLGGIGTWFHKMWKTYHENKTRQAMIKAGWKDEYLKTLPGKEDDEGD